MDIKDREKAEKILRTLEFSNDTEFPKLMKKYKANQSDPSILNEYTEAAQKAMDMQKDASSCTDPAYASKLMELANQIAKAAM